MIKISHEDTYKIIFRNKGIIQYSQGIVFFSFKRRKLSHTRNNTPFELLVTFFLNLHRLFTLLLPAPHEKAKAFSNKSL